MKKLLIISLLLTALTVLSNPLSHSGLPSRGIAASSLRQSTPQQRFIPARDIRPETLAKAPHVQPQKQLATARIRTIKQTTQVHQANSLRPIARTLGQRTDQQNIRTLKHFNRRNLILVGDHLEPWWWYYHDYPTDLYNEDGTPIAGTAEPTQFLEEPNQNELEQTECYNECMNRPQTQSEEECNQECGATEQ